MSSCPSKALCTGLAGGSQTDLSELMEAEGGCAGKWLTTSFPQGNIYSVIAFANSYGINCPIVADFKGPMGRLWKRCTESGLENKQNLAPA